jgi:hypothetical protein
MGVFVWSVSSRVLVEFNDSMDSFDAGSSKEGFASSGVLGSEEGMLGFDQFRVLRICKEEGFCLFLMNWFGR